MPMTELTLTSEVSDADYRHVCRSLLAYNITSTQGRLEQPDVNINLIVKDAEGTVLGGIFCDTFLHTTYIDVLWVDERIRGQGYGQALIEEAERIARSHGCTLAHTCTFSYQAPGFYTRQGYTIFAVLDDYPDGIKQYFLKKAL
jgi:GNAT superfamily N-acetyltransferase